jgi:hypothetical protein
LTASTCCCHPCFTSAQALLSLDALPNRRSSPDRAARHDAKGPLMAKALLGHLGGSDPATAAELVALRRRVRELQDEVLVLREQMQHLTLDRLDTELSAPALSAPELSVEQLSAEELSPVG